MSLYTYQDCYLMYYLMLLLMWLRGSEVKFQSLEQPQNSMVVTHLSGDLR